MRKTWFIADADSALGQKLLIDALDNGDEVVAISASPLDFVQRLPLAYRASDALCVQQADLADQWQAVASVERALTYFGGIDVLVNNAASPRLGHFEALRSEDFDATLAGRVHATINVTQALLPALREQHHGHIINFGADTGPSALLGYSAVNAAGHAVEGLSQSLASEIIGFGLFVTCIKPLDGLTDSAALTWADPQLTDYFSQPAMKRAPDDPHAIATTARLVREMACTSNPPNLVSVPATTRRPASQGDDPATRLSPHPCERSALAAVR